MMATEKIKRLLKRRFGGWKNLESKQYIHTYLNDIGNSMYGLARI